MRARTWGTLGALFAVVFTAIQIQHFGWLHPIGLLHLLVILPLCFALGGLPWSRYYTTHYLPVARIIAPLACVITAAFSAQGAAEGRHEVLVVITLQMVGVFYFTGLLFHTAFASCIAALAGFTAGMVLFGLPTDVTIKYALMLATAASVAVVAYRDTECVLRTEFLERRLIAEMLERDPLTGLKNRRVFDEQLQRAWHQAQRDKRSIAVLMVDVDDFKSFNDIYGHQAGDEALRRVGLAMRDFGRRPLDLVARYGGEEFAVILHDLAPEYTREVAECLRRSVEALAIPHRGANAAPVVTLSIGAAIVEPSLGRTTQGAVQLADEALYEAKHGGRNRVVVKGLDAYKTLITGVFNRPRTAAEG